MTRNSSFELLRIILMLIIVVHHCIVHGMGLAGLDQLRDTPILIPDSWMLETCVINSLCICAVNCFVLISGYFGIKTTLKKVVYLIFALTFYTITLGFIPYFIDGDYLNALKSLLILSRSPYWFVIDYLFMMAFTPMINFAFEEMSSRYIKMFILSLLAISIYWGFVWGHNANNNGYTLMQFIFIYCVGRLIRKKNVFLGKWLALGGYILSSITCGITMWVLWQLGYPGYAWRMTYYNNPLIILSAIFLFMAFKNITIDSKLINTIAQSAFGIYLFQTAPLIKQILYERVKSVTLQYQHESFEGSIYILINILLYSIIVVFVAVLFDRIRITLSDIILRKIK